MSTPSSDPFALRSVTHTSQSHPLVLVPVAVGALTLYATIPPGCRGIVAHEDYGLIDIERDMSADVDAMSKLGVHRLVSMMSAVDILTSGLGGLLTDLEGARIQWTHLPFPDRRLPDEGFPRYLIEQAGLIRRDLMDGAKVAIHGVGWNAAFTRNLSGVLHSIDGTASERLLHRSARVAAALGRLLVPM